MTTVPAYDASAFPPELCALPQWVAWRYEERDGKATKVPVNIHNGRMALTNAPSTWGTIEEAIPYARRQGYGVGFVFSAGDPFAGIDLDRCIDAETRRVKPWAWEIITDLSSYTEVSPSGLGIKVIVRAALPEGRRGWGDGHGMYDRARFFTMTGCRVPDMPAEVEERQAEIVALHAKLFPPQQANSAKSGPTPLRQWDDAEVIQRAMSATNGVKFSRLWLGDRSGYDSDSEADAGLVSMLAFWTGPDAERLDALFRQSGLMRGKWERASYRDKTVALALKRATYYTPRPPSGGADGIKLFRRRESA